MCRTELPEPVPPSRPFCSPRCKKLDLMNWLEGRYTLPRAMTPEDVLSLSPEEQTVLFERESKLLS